MNVGPQTRRSRSLHAFVLACLILVGSFGDSIHRAQVRHRVCAEHGDIVHVAMPLPDAIPSDPSEASSHAAPEFRGVETSTDDAHDACSFAAFARDGGLPSLNAPRAIVATAAAMIPDARPETPRVADIPQFLLAPKHSPPV
jgi:hypothetical protein